MATQNIYVMIGLPGSGKDTWIKNNLPDCKYVASRDDIRIELGICEPGGKGLGDSRQEGLVSSIFDTKLLEYVRSGEDVVINNINLKKRFRMHYHQLLRNFVLNWIYIIIKAPSIEDNIKRRAGQIPPEVIRSMAERYEEPTPDEYNEIHIIQQ